MRTNRPRLAEGLARIQQALASDLQPAATAQVHHWLAVELRLGPDTNRDQLLGWDTTALPADFNLARQILLRHDERARGSTGGPVRTRPAHNVRSGCQ